MPVGRWFGAPGQRCAHAQSVFTSSGGVDHQGRARVATDLNRVIQVADLSGQVNVIYTDAHAQWMIAAVRGDKSDGQDRAVGQVQGEAMS